MYDFLVRPTTVGNMKTFFCAKEISLKKTKCFSIFEVNDWSKKQVIGLDPFFCCIGLESRLEKKAEGGKIGLKENIEDPSHVQILE